MIFQEGRSMGLRDLRTTTYLAVRELLDRTHRAMRTKEPVLASRALDLSELEDRILLSASPMAVVTDMINGASVGPMLADTATVISEFDAGPDAALQIDDQHLTEQDGSTVSVNPFQTASRELVFLDTSVGDYQQLLDDLWSNDDSSREFEVVLLQNSRDGIEQITEALARLSGLDAVHIVSHGTDTAVKLGSTWLNQETIAGYVGEMARWGRSLSGGADLLFYGCDLAASSDGEALLESVQLLTGADVGASTDDTGHAIFGGDWDLEFATGNIETQVAFSSNTQQSWMQILNVTVDASSSGATADQSSVTVSHTTSGTNRLMLVGVSMELDGDSVSSVTYNGTNLTLVGT